MQSALKREAIRAYKERKPEMGIYAIRCAATDQTWVGQSKSLNSQRNRFWFALRLGDERCEAMQAAWDRHGSESFSFVILTQLSDDETLYPEARLSELLAAWSGRLRALAVA